MKFNIMQHFDQCFPAHWFLPPPSSPFPEDLCVDSFDFSVIMFYVVDSSSMWVIQEVEAKIIVIGADLSGNVDCSPQSLESGALEHSWAVCSNNT